MSLLSGLRHRLRELLLPGRVARELRDELEEHFEQEVRRQVRDGVAPNTARREATIRIGNLRAAHDAVGDERTGRVLHDWLADLRVATRAIRRQPAFTTAVVTSLALGVGGTTAVFSVVHAVLLRPLPYSEPDRLAVMRIWWKDFSARLSPADMNALEETAGQIASVGAFFSPNDGFTMATASGPELIDGAVVTRTLPAVLGISPTVGPGFSIEPNAREALIGDTLWRRRYNASPGAIGQSIVLDGERYTIVGVMPPGFNVPRQRGGSVWIKTVSRPVTRRGPFYFYTIARLARGLSTEAAAERLTTVVAPVLQAKYSVERTWRYGAEPLQEALVADVRRSLLLLLGAMGLLLLIAIVNVMNLMLARGTARTRELAVRASLGAGRGRLARHLLAESALLGLLGGILGLAFASMLLSLAGGGTIRALPMLDALRLDTMMVVFAMVCGIGTALLASLVPIVRTPWNYLASVLRGGGRAATDTRSHAHMRQALVVCEVALTVTILTGAVLLGRSLLRLQTVDPGFEPANVVSFRLSLPDDPYDNEQRLAAFVATLEERLRARSEVADAAFSLALPPNLLALSNNYTMEGAVTGAAGSGGVAEWNVVSTGYFSTMGIELRQGRPFSESDRATTTRVAIVNEAFARRRFPDGRVLGARFKSGQWDVESPWTTIVGVVADVPYGKGLWGGADATVYLPYAQNFWMQSFYVVLRSQGDLSRVLANARATVQSLDSNLPLRDPATMSTRMRDSMVEPRLRSLVFALIGGLALALAVTGIYGVLAYQVNQRRHETAIRRALGATLPNIVGIVLASGLRMTLGGIVLGATATFWLSRSLSTVLFQITPQDPGSFATVAVLLTVAALLACILPALRSARIEPAAVLREE